MEPFVFYNRTRLIFGKDAESRFLPYLPENTKNILIHYGGGSAIKSGLIPKIEEQLQNAGYRTLRFGDVQANPRLSLVKEGIQLCRENAVDFILAVGGGSVIDSAKAISFGVNYDGDVWDFFEGFTQGKRATDLIPVGCVLTIPAAGSETSQGSVITNDEGKKRCAEGVDSRPYFAVMNPEYTCTLSPYQTACGVADMMAHIMERYFTNTPNNDLTDELCEGALRSIIRNGKKVMQDPQDLDARAQLMLAGTIAQNDLLGLGRASDWGAHMIEHELSGMYDIAHGAGLTIVFPAWMRYVYCENVPLFARYARNVWGCCEDDDEKAALQGIERTEEFWASLGLPIRLHQAGIGEEHLSDMAKSATTNRTLGRFKVLHTEDVENILELSK